MPVINNVFIEHNNIKLEAELYKPDSSKERIIVLLIHPHPSYGGNMYNNVISAIFQTLINNDKLALRFNFRGVGRSTGSHSGDDAEIDDVKACIDYILSTFSSNKILICGYSYGAAIGCSLVNYSEKIIGYCAISFPWDFMGMKYKKLSQSNKLKLFIQGDQDTLAFYNKFGAHYESYSDPKSKKVIKGADHFFWGFENLVAEEVTAFIMEFDEKL